MTTPHSTENLIKRQAKLAAQMPEMGLDALAINASQSMVYFTGLHFHVMERPTVALLTADKAPALVLPELEKNKTADLGFELQVFTYSEDPATWAPAFEKAAKQLELDQAKIGVDPLHLRVLELRYLETALPQAQFVDGGEVIARLRRIKDAGEVAAMQAAVDVAEAALKATLSQIKIGMTEKQIAGILVTELLRGGSEPEMPFAPIVAAGPNSANPHATPSERPIQAGDLLLFDWGASVDGYFSDITRTFAVGALDPELLRIHEIVQLANQAGRQAAAPGAACAVVDLAAREAIEDNGYGEYFIHRTGHGLGMEAHEEPYMRSGNQAKLEPGMVFTVEPGIYLPGRGGVRIEDNVVVIKDGIRSLTTFPRELQIVG